MMMIVAELYLAVWAFAVSLCVGAVSLLALGHLTGARWLTDSAYAHQLARLARALPIVALGFVPVALACHTLYAWTGAATPYLNVPFWIARAVGCFALWIAIARGVVRGSPVACAIALPAIGLTTMFAAIDWVMSRAAPWTSTVFGLAFWIGGALGAMAFAAAVGRKRATPYQAGAVGRLLLAILCTWAYLALSSAFIIWIAHKPAETVWYAARTTGAWGGVFGALAIGGFALPFFALLPAAPKRRPRFLAAIGAWLVAIHLLELVWLVLP